MILSALICGYDWNHKPWCIHIYSVSFFEFTWLNLCHLLLALSKKPNITSWFSVQNFTHETLYSAFEYSCEKCCFWPHSPETVKLVLFLVVSEMHVYSDWTITTKTYAPKIQFFWICHFSLSTVNLCGKMHKRLCLLNLVFYAWTSCANHVLKICATCEKLHHLFYWILNMYVINALR